MEKKIHIKDDVIVECPYTLHDARLGLKKLLLNNPKITAIICGQDVLAIGALLEAQKQGLKIPTDLSIIGFDDLEISRHMMPSLTTIHIDAIGMWAQAANHLISQINGVSNLPRKIKANTHLVIRESSSIAPTPKMKTRN
jgi:LacI family transcriptional regulator